MSSNVVGGKICGCCCRYERIVSDVYDTVPLSFLNRV